MGRGTSAATPAVVVGLDCITGLQTARILARRGVPVIGLAGDPRHACTRTRLVERVVQTPTHGPALLNALEALLETLPSGAVLVPCTDAAVLTLARGRGQLGDGYKLLLPDTAVVEMLMDKLHFYEFAEAHGFPVPATRVVRTRAEAQAAARDLSFPCILKPTLKTPEWERHSQAKVHRAESAPELMALYDRYSPYAEALMIQQWIDGSDADLYSCNCYFDQDSQPLVTFVARKLRQWPPRMGTSSLGEECRNDTVLELTKRIFGAAGYKGLGYLEVKRDASTGRHYVIEPNVGRPTGRSAIAEAGGVELLYTMYCDAVGRPLPSEAAQQYRGAKWIYWRQDFRSALYYWRRGELSLREWAASWRGRKATAVFSWSDPMPFLFDMASMPARLLTRGRSGKQARSKLRPPAEKASPTGQSPLVARTNGGGARGAREDGHVDIDVAGVMSVRVVGATSQELAAVHRQLGRAAPTGAGEPDVVLRFVDRLSRRGLRHVEVGHSAFTREGYMVRAPGVGSPWVRVPFEDAGLPCEFVCERGVRRVPLLKHFLRVRALNQGYLPFHASAFEWQGAGVLVAGWSHGGKTSSLLAFGANGARYVGDDLVLIAGDGSTMRGLAAPISISEWHLSQLPHLQESVGYRKRMAAAATRRLNAAALAAHKDGGSAIPAFPLRAAAKLAQKKSRVTLSIDEVFPGGSVPAATPRKLFLMMSAEDGGFGVEPVDGQTVADRMRHSLAAESLPMLEHYHSYRYGGIGSDNPLIEGMAERERQLLATAVAGLDAYIARHPYPAPFGPLFDAMRPACEAPSAVSLGHSTIA